MTTSEKPDAETKPEQPRRLVLAFLPLLIFAAVAVLFLFRLYAGDASRIPSALIGTKVPQFNLAPVEGLADKPGLTDADLRQGHVTLVNVFASWCGPCHQEHPVLALLAKDPKLAAAGVRLVGLAYKDEPANTTRFLTREGNPYARIGADRDGMTGIDFGVYGVPETFVVKGDGTIAYKFIGPMTEESIRDTLLPEIEKAGS
jgi:cytochrome c biogenesis protein CcmG, thiol:disulfide interchange protein DsbE